ncbi:MAG: hypothetical protein OEY63_01405 [Gemmatimonadota bacterium]|nr:hypothetical protein [Gemmatimonadota bacterium]MDH5804439.1 hypothetical protein [Gemmatimonadota bacterium]
MKQYSISTFMVQSRYQMQPASSYWAVADRIGIQLKDSTTWGWV